MEKSVPFDLDAECGVLGSILLDPASFHEVADHLTSADFYRDSHRVIYETIAALHNKRVLPDVITVSSELERCEGADVEFGYLVELVNMVPTSGRIAYYAEIVVQMAVCRRLLHAAGQIAHLAYHRDEHALEKAEQLLYAVQKPLTDSSFVSMPDLMTAYMEELDYLHAHRGAVIGIPTGYDALDDPLGGLQKSDLILLAGRPGMGKTSLGLCIGYNAALRGKKVAIFSLEMGRNLLARRLMSMRSKVDMQRLRSGWISDDEWEIIVDSAGGLSQLSLHINDTAGNPVSSMRSQLRRLSREGRVDLVIIDYLGLIEPDTDTAKRETLVQQISTISRGLKGLAREFDLPVLALCQLSRAVESRGVKVPLLSDLRDSGSLEQDSDVVLFVYRDDYYAKLEQRPSAAPNIADVYIAKHRNGPTGKVSLYFQADQTMFYPLEVTRES